MPLTADPTGDTWLVGGLLGLAVLFSLRRRGDRQLFPVSATQELKGLAILFIIFSHVGYTLGSDDSFLRPLSNFVGVGVNIFLLMSGFGLTLSSLKNQLPIRKFYAKRLKKLFVPFWIVLAGYFLLDWLVLNKTYGAGYMGKSFLGIFETAEAFSDVNSPLWYFTLILFYYLIFPLIFSRRFTWLSAVALFLINYLLIHYSFLRDIPNVGLYKFYTVAFPLGVFIAWTLNQPQVSTAANKILNFLKPASIKSNLAYFSVLVVLPLVFLAVRSFTGPYQEASKEQSLNIITVLIVLLFFLVKRFSVKLLSLFGLYSFEIYLIHWPLMSKYDVYFKHTYGWLAVALYLVIFLALGWILQKLTGRLTRRTRGKVLNKPAKNVIVN